MFYEWLMNQTLKNMLLLSFNLYAENTEHIFVYLSACKVQKM